MMTQITYLIASLQIMIRLKTKLVQHVAYGLKLFNSKKHILI